MTTWTKATVDQMIAQHGMAYMIARHGEYLHETNPTLYKQWLAMLDKQKPEAVLVKWPWVN
jgi:hypothetical protein